MGQVVACPSGHSDDAHRRVVVAVATFAVAVTGACSSSSSDETDDTARVVQLGAPGETSRVLGADELDELGVRPATPTPTSPSCRR